MSDKSHAWGIWKGFKLERFSLYHTVKSKDLIKIKSKWLTLI